MTATVPDRSGRLLSRFRVRTADCHIHRSGEDRGLFSVLRGTRPHVAVVPGDDLVGAIDVDQAMVFEAQFRNVRLDIESGKSTRQRVEFGSKSGTGKPRWFDVDRHIVDAMLRSEQVVLYTMGNLVALPNS